MSIFKADNFIQSLLTNGLKYKHMKMIFCVEILS